MLRMGFVCLTYHTDPYQILVVHQYGDSIGVLPLRRLSGLTEKWGRRLPGIHNRQHHPSCHSLRPKGKHEIGNEWVRQESYIWCIVNDNIRLKAGVVRGGIPLSEVFITARREFNIGLHR